MGFYQNTCKPEGLGGKLMTQLMNGGHHAKLAEWGFSFLTVPANAN
ncbi:MAG: SAM-dependent methyltransferase, partial [Eubacteriales bacterium]|nr:SAM-dependent methyltransferase [Eubacteriales bacterium]